ncbi:Uncharacterised protein [uncultured archaeon]|nr:Uncharacterised protein [uncultured archaeon]
MGKLFQASFFVLAILLTLSFVSALSVSGPFFAASGQCETTMQKYSVCATIPGTYSVSAAGSGSSWVSLAPTSLNLSGGSCADVFAFITPDCYASSGTYAPRFIVSGAEDYNAPITIEINQAHTFDFSISDSSIVSAPCVENVINATLKNTGKFKDEFVISQSSLPAGWNVSSGSKILVDPYAQASFQIKITPACSANSGNYTFSINLANTRTNASASKQISVGVEGIIPLSVSGLFDKKSSLDMSLCRDTADVRHFDVNNFSAVNDTFSFYLLDANNNLVPSSVASFDKASVSVASGKSVDLNLLIGKNAAGIVPLTFRAHSLAFDKNYDSLLNINFENCYALSILRESNDANSCVAKSEQRFILTNGGTKAFDSNVSLFAGAGLVESKSVSVNPQSSSEVYFTLNPVSAGSVAYRVVAETFFGEAAADFNYLFENCYSSIIESQNVEYCKNSAVDFNATITNTGTKAQEFTIATDAPWLNVIPDKITILPAGAQSININGVAAGSIAKTYTIKAISTEGTLSKTISFTALAENNCRDFSYAVTSDVVDVNCGGGKIVDLNLTNAGAFDTNISLSKVFPQWVSFSEEKVTLSPAQTKTIFVYFSPPSGTIGKISGLLAAKNDANISKDINVSLNVLLGSCSAISADGNLDNSVSGIKTISRKEVTIDFILSNDSNSGYNVYDINAPDYNVAVDFNKGVFVDANTSLGAKITFRFAEGADLVDQNVLVTIKTSAGDLNKVVFVKFSEASTQMPITGFFGAASVTAIGGLLVILLIVLALLALAKVNTNSKKPKLRK